MSNHCDCGGEIRLHYINRSEIVYSIDGNGNQDKLLTSIQDRTTASRYQCAGCGKVFIQLYTDDQRAYLSPIGNING